MILKEVIKIVKVREDLTGKVFGRLTVLKQADDYISPRSGTHYAQWLCQCNCEDKNLIIVRGICLKQGLTKSCGCIKKEIEYARSRIPNLYNLDGEYGIGWTNNTNKEFYFDLEDYNKIKDYFWYENVDKNGYHSIKAMDFKSGKYVKMPWIIVGKCYDHEDRNPFNNRKQNLRPATTQENAQNHSKRRDNKSGVTGVYWDKGIGKWRAYITKDKIQINLGSFDKKDDAIITRLKAEKKYFGEFAPQKHLYKQYGVTEEDNNDGTAD